jgi:hypothetical protein
MNNYEYNDVDIMRMSVPIEDLCGVYFLLDDDGRVVYVGQSVFMFSRIAAHSRDKKFSRVMCISCDFAELDAMESHYINKFRPKYNGKYPNGCMISPITNFDFFAESPRDRNIRYLKQAIAELSRCVKAMDAEVFGNVLDEIEFSDEVAEYASLIAERAGV